MNAVALTNGRAWLSPRRKRFWGLVLVGAYTLLGFFVVPWALKAQLPALAQEYLKRDARVDEVAFNPWLLRLQATGLHLLDTDASDLLSVEAIEVNLQTRSVLQLALVFRDVKLVGPRFNVVRRRFGDSNVGDWVNDLTATAAAASDSDTAAASEDGLRLVIDKLQISAASIDIVDKLPATPFETTLGPINISLDNLSTLPNDAGEQVVVITAETGAELSWTGSLQVAPLMSAGTLRLDGSPLTAVHRYFSDQLNFSFDDCCLDISLNYALEATPDGGIAVAIDAAELELRDVVLRDPADQTQILKLPELRVQGGELRWPAATARVTAVEVNSLELNAWLTQSGELSLTQLVRTAPTAAPEPVAVTAAETDTAQPASPDWDIAIDTLAINALRFGFTDRQLTPAGRLEVQSLDLTLTDISNQPGRRIPFTAAAQLAGGGSLALEGDTALLPEVALNSQLSIAGLALQQLQPWVQTAAQVAIDAGDLNLTGSLSSDGSEILALRGDLDIRQLQVSDTLENEPLVGWNTLKLDDLRLGLDAALLELSAIELDQPFARLIIDAQGSTNFAALAVSDASAAPESAAAGPDNSAVAEPEAGAGFTVRVGASKVSNGALDFADLALPLPFRAKISELEGSLSALASDSQQPSTLALEGKVGEFGLAAIDGNLNVVDPTRQADIEVRFRNVNMPDLSPYTAKFAGRKIESGKLDLTLDYVFDERLMKGDNQMTLAAFELGEKVESPEALDLPLGLAVALLRDVNGKIDLSLGVSGDLDDPEFSATGIILKTFANLITKAVAAPFKLLGGLLPGGADVELDSILFRAGRADLAPPEQEKIVLLGDALAQRPSLLLDVAGGVNAELDIPALQAAAVATQVAERLGAAADADVDEQLLRKTRRALEKLADEADVLGELSVRELQAQFTEPATETEAERFDEVAYMADLRGRLEAAENISEAQLAELTEARAAAITAALAERQLGVGRVRQTAAVTGEGTDDGWVSIKLGLEAGATAPPATKTDDMNDDMAAN